MSKRCALLVALLALAVASTGCARIWIHHSSKPTDIADKNPPQEASQKSILLGFKSLSSPVNLEEKCPTGWHLIKTESSFLSSVFRTLTLNLYSPWNTEVTCAVPKPERQGTKQPGEYVF